MYAHVTNGTVDALGSPPATVFSEADNRWYDLRTLNAATLALVGWYLVNETTRPADTAQNTSDATYVFDTTVVNQVWVVRAKTPQEVANATALANETTVRSALDSRLAQLDSEIIDLTPSQLFVQAANSNALKLLARTLRLVIRVLISKFDGTQ